MIAQINLLIKLLHNYVSVCLSASYLKTTKYFLNVMNSTLTKKLKSTLKI